MSSGRILVADDHEVNQLLVVDMLEQAGLRCDAVSDGAQAVKQTASGNYDVILMDCQMPVMDGFDATARIRAGSARSGRPANTFASSRLRPMSTRVIANDVSTPEWTTIAGNLFDAISCSRRSADR